MDPILFTTLVVITVCVLFYFTEKLLIRINFDIPNDVLGIYLNVVGVLYTLILAFVVVNVWQNYQVTVVALEEEAHVLMDIREAASEIPSPGKEKVIASVIAYANAVRTDEWSKMAQEEESELAKEKLNELLELRKYLLTDTSGIEPLADVCSGIKILRERRHTRLMMLHLELPKLMWIILIVGGVLCVVLSFFLHVKNIFWQTILTTMMTSMLAMVLLLIFSLSNPFSGSTAIDPLPFEEVEIGGHSHGNHEGHEH